MKNSDKFLIRAGLNKEYFSLPFLFFIAGSLIAVQLIQHLPTNDQLIFLLYPTQKIVGLFLRYHFTWSSSLGFMCDELPITIERSCSGFTFFLVSIIVGVAASFRLEGSKKIRLLVILPLMAYGYTLLVNSVRVIVSIKINEVAQGKSWFPDHMAHELTGFLYMISFIVLFYLFMRYLIAKTTLYGNT